MSELHESRILILDFGSQYTQLIARRVREIGVYCEILPYDCDEARINQFGAKGIILSGGPESVTQTETPRIPQTVFDLKIPVLGICYGMQALVHQLGGEVASHGDSEFGHADLILPKASDLWGKLSGKLDVWMSHGDCVSKLPDGFATIGESRNAPMAAVEDVSRHYYGLQFHPEVTHTKDGQQILQNFVCGVCKCEALWKPENIIEDAIAKIKEQVGDDKVLLGLSGGVDSSVVAALLHRAIGDKLTCIFVDNGLLRLNEGDQVMDAFAKHMGVNVIRANAQEQFLGALYGTSDPELKRKIVGHEFINVFDEQAAKLKDIKWLAQGTIYPDVIESAGSKDSHVIKSHHNVGGLPDDMAFKLIEPLRELFKDEVRRIGLELGLPKDFIGRHPFPGPGLTVRIPGEVTKAKADLLREADDIFITELRAANLYDEVSQAFAVLLPIESVAVIGDQRLYAPVICLRAVTTTDFMTAHVSNLPLEFLEKVSRRICNEVKGISRVLYDITSKPPATIEWE